MAGAAYAILLAMRDGSACGAERLGEPAQPIGHMQPVGLFGSPSDPRI